MYEGKMMSWEWVRPGDQRPDELEPGLYVLIKVPDDSQWKPGAVHLSQ